ncbi:MAG: TatD family hydrolase [Patescibacteria group bacterium]
MLIDSHIHLPHKKYEKDVDLIVQEATIAGITKLIVIGTHLKDNEIVSNLVSKYPNLYCSLGIYPNDELSTNVDELATKLEVQIKNSSKIKAIGECGIDITDWENQRSINEQIKLFEAQLFLAQKYKLPIVIHNRNGDEQVLNSIKKFPDVTGVLHCFASSWEYGKKFIDAGYYLSFAGLITYRARRELLETVVNVPANRYVIETDSPYLPPEGHRGETNYPKYVKIIAEKVAETRNISFEQVCEESYNNTVTLFKL